MGAAIATSAPSAATRSTPNFRKTPATIAMTIGIGSASITRRTSPDAPSTSTSRPVTRNAPITSGQDRCPSDPPTRIVPGIVQAKPRGCR